MQQEIFGFNESNSNRRIELGQSKIYYRKAASILTPASGFMEEYDYTLNPYSGCSFGCTYCYAAFFTSSNALKEGWGYWVNVKENALELLLKHRKKPLINKTIYLSSVTDPYQPIEKELGLTRSILKELLNHHDIKLVIQTRSPLIVRDIDLLKCFKILQVNMTITTDNEIVRKVFEPHCPSNKIRLEAITRINNEGINSCITMTPLLPLENVDLFARTLLETGVKKYIIQPFHSDKGKFVAGTREEAVKLLNQYNWTNNNYQKVLETIKKYIPNVGIGKEGFAPI